MAEIKSINMEDDKTSVCLFVSDSEYNLLKEDNDDLVILPVKKLNEVLTTGKIGNSNRIMLPKKIMKAHKIDELPKNVEARVFSVNNCKFLLIKLAEKKIGVPEYDEK